MRNASRHLREIFAADGAVSAWNGKLLARLRAADGFSCESD
jgi:hypothetical protein